MSELAILDEIRDPPSSSSESVGPSYDLEIIFGMCGTKITYAITAIRSQWLVTDDGVCPNMHAKS